MSAKARAAEGETTAVVACGESAAEALNPRFAVGALRDLAGEITFARGAAYHRAGRVVMLGIEPERVLTRVMGTDDYRTELTGRGKEIGGRCSCPAFYDTGFCEHMVAVALTANLAGGDVETDGAGALSRIRNHLKEKDVAALVEIIMGLVEWDSALFSKLDLAATIAQADDKTLEARLRKVIDDAVNTGGFVDYHAAPSWAAGVETALDIVADLVPGARAGIALKLAERAIDLIGRAVEDIDDSDGHCGALLHRARDIHVAAARVERPEPVQFARDLFARETEGDYETLYGAVALYAEVLGEEGLAEYRRLAVEAWERLPARSGKDRSRYELSGSYRELKGILDFFAERDGDIDARIALRAKDLSSPWDYLQLAEFCLSQGREKEALRRAEEGLWVFEDSWPDARLTLFAAKLLPRAGRKQDAERYLWQVFEKEPSLELYARLRKLAGEVARERAIGHLESRLGDAAHMQWNGQTGLLIRILMHENMLDEAWAVVRAHGAFSGEKEALARASEATHPREAIEVYTERVVQLAGIGGNPAYGEAARLVGHMATLRNAAEQASYVAALKTRFGRKRNFMKLLG